MSSAIAEEEEKEDKDTEEFADADENEDDDEADSGVERNPDASDARGVAGGGPSRCAIVVEVSKNSGEATWADGRREAVGRRKTAAAFACADSLVFCT